MMTSETSLFAYAGYHVISCRIILTTAYLRYGRICHILQAIANRPYGFLSKFK